MTEKSKAQRLADILQHKIPSIECLEQSAAELRRLDALNAELVEALEAIHGERSRQYHAFKLRDASEAGFSALDKAKEQT